MADQTFTVAGSTAEFGDSLDGWEEVAIGKAFGARIQSLGDEDPMFAIRALVFAHLMRGGASSKDAKAQAFGMSRLAVSEYFEFMGHAPGVLEGDDESPKAEPGD